MANSLAVAIRAAQLNGQIERHAAELEQRVAERTAALSDANVNSAKAKTGWPASSGPRWTLSL